MIPASGKKLLLALGCAALGGCETVPARYEIVLVDAAIAPLSYDHHAIQFGVDLPDPYVCLRFDGREGMRCTRYGRDTRSPRWNEILDVVDEGTLRAGFLLSVLDDDTGPLGGGLPDTICPPVRVAFTDAMMRARGTRVHCEGSSVVMRIREQIPAWQFWR